MRAKPIRKGSSDQTTALCLDTIALGKQALVFCASKRAAESQAEKIAKGRKEEQEVRSEVLDGVADKALDVLAHPTKQCKRLAACLRKGIAFHHAGLPSGQRTLIEQAFRDGTIRVICSTPTLAAGLDLPAFRAVIRDHKRFSGQGMAPIPVLEYLQMAGRAGRPGMEEYGEAILVAGNQEEIERLTETYIHGIVEDIHSKLAVEPVLRTYILSLVATEIITTKQELIDFFSETFYAKQFGNMKRLIATLTKMIKLLKKWEFLEQEEQEKQGSEESSSIFVTASEMYGAEQQANEEEKLVATPLGQRVSEIYLDPLTAHLILEGMSRLEKELRSKEDEEQTFAVQHLISCSLEMRPLLRMKTSAVELVENIMDEQELILLDENDFYEYSQDDYEDTILTASFLNDWSNEFSEQQLLDKYGIRPGEITIKLQRGEWLMYACEELARVTKKKRLLSILRHIALRTKHGVRSELITLLKFKGIGRVRARTLHAHGITSVKDVKQAQMEKLKEIIGPKTARQLKEEAGEKVEEQQGEEEDAKAMQAKPKKRSGQTDLNHYQE
ncbi:MAG: helicase-related protein [Candidatus Woesearchaeota archaeon]